MNRPEDDLPIAAIIIFAGLLFVLIIVMYTIMAYGDKEMSAEVLVAKELKIEEGFRSKPYKDTTGHWTIGYGHNLQGNSYQLHELENLFKDHAEHPHTLEQYIKYWNTHPMSQEDAEYILDADILIAESIVKRIYKDQWHLFDDERKAALIDLAFNLGEPTYRKFKHHIAATKKQDWEESSKQILNSEAAKQASRRYRKIARRLKEG